MQRLRQRLWTMKCKRRDAGRCGRYISDMGQDFFVYGRTVALDPGLYGSWIGIASFPIVSRPLFLSLSSFCTSFACLVKSSSGSWTGTVSIPFVSRPFSLSFFLFLSLSISLCFVHYMLCKYDIERETYKPARYDL